MKKPSLKLTTAQFAGLHGVNKRTLHYYDAIDLFSPITKGDNKYRYYDIMQSIDFEYILMLKELHMSIEEIKQYLKKPNAEDFIFMADTKIQDLEIQIKNLMKTKEVLQMKKEQIEYCLTCDYHNIEIMECDEEIFLTTPYDFEENTVSQVFTYVKDIWGIEQIRMGIGSYISVDKIIKKEYETYDGLFTPALQETNVGKILIKPKGRYICGYQKGTWDHLPDLYVKMVEYAKNNHLHLIGYAYEIGLNDFVITNEEEYITKIMIQVV